jgi:hypothetical protein
MHPSVRGDGSDGEDDGRDLCETPARRGSQENAGGTVGHMDQLLRVTSLDAKRIERALLERAAEAKALLGRHIPQAREMLKN